MKTSEQIFDQYNKELKQKLIPEKTLPIYGSSFENPNDEDYIPYKSFKELQELALDKVVKECLKSKK